MTLLCIDDDQDDAELLREAVELVDVNCTCITALSGAEGLRILRGIVPDHIILDINMPRMDGRETLLKIRKTDATCRVPVHILSTTASAPEIAALKKIGATSFLTKPNSFDGLCDFVRSLLRTDGKNGKDNGT